MREPLLDVGSHVLVADVVVWLVADVRIDLQRLVGGRPESKSAVRAVGIVQPVCPAVHYQQRQVDLGHTLLMRTTVSRLSVPHRTVARPVTRGSSA